jgi:hypothetical protein
VSASKRKTVAWYKRGSLYVVRPAGWPKLCELSFTTKGQMLAWANESRVILRNTGRRDAF